jgi:hypothetical protein
VAGKGLAVFGSSGRHGVVWPVKDLFKICVRNKDRAIDFNLCLFSMPSVRFHNNNDQKFANLRGTVAPVVGALCLVPCATVP